MKKIKGNVCFLIKIKISFGNLKEWKLFNLFLKFFEKFFKFGCEV